MNHAHDDRCLARPFKPPIGADDHAVMLENRCQTCIARIALADRVRGDEAERSAGANQSEGSAEEMRDEVGVAVRAFVKRLQPRQITCSICPDDAVLTREWRITNDGVEAAIF